MTLAEYIQKDGSVRAKTGSVVLTPDQVTIFQPGVPLPGTKGEKRMWQVREHSFGYIYVVASGSNILYTQDEDGNLKRPSVFSLQVHPDTIKNERRETAI